MLFRSIKVIADAITNVMDGRFNYVFYKSSLEVLLYVRDKILRTILVTSYKNSTKISWLTPLQPTDIEPPTLHTAALQTLVSKRIHSRK